MRRISEISGRISEISGSISACGQARSLSILLVFLDFLDFAEIAQRQLQLDQLLDNSFAVSRDSVFNVDEQVGADFRWGLFGFWITFFFPK